MAQTACHNKDMKQFMTSKVPEAVMEYRKRCEQLKQLLASPVMVPAGELERIKEQNTRRRKAVLQKKIRDLQILL